MSDLLKKLGSKQAAAEGAGSPEPRQAQEVTTSSTGGISAEVGNNLLKSTGENKSESAATGQAKTANTVSSESNTPNLSESEGSVKNPDSWTIDSAFSEIKKLREENKARRLKYEESVEKMKQDMESRLKSYEEEMNKAKEAQQRLQEMESKEADKKRSLEEKLTHRESLLSEYKTKIDYIEKSYEEKIGELQTQLQSYLADKEAEKEVYQSRLNQELSVIPEKFKGVAELIVKGAGDPRDALVALNEAKVKGVFEDKTILVNHSVPGARDGARATKERLDEASKAERAKLSSTQKISEALKSIRSGEKNSAFRQNNN